MKNLTIKTLQQPQTATDHGEQVRSFINASDDGALRNHGQWKRLNLRIPKEFHRQLKRWCVLNDLTMVDVIVDGARLKMAEVDAQRNL